VKAVLHPSTEHRLLYWCRWTYSMNNSKTISLYCLLHPKCNGRGYFSSAGGPALQITVNKFQRLSYFIQSTMYRPLPTSVPVLRITVNTFTICSIACYVSYEVLYHDQELYTIQAFGVEAFAITKCDCSSLEHLHWWSASHYGQQN